MKPAGLFEDPTSESHWAGLSASTTGQVAWLLSLRILVCKWRQDRCQCCLPRGDEVGESGARGCADVSNGWLRRAGGRAEPGVWPSALNLFFFLTAGPLMDYLPAWQKIYFYSWG